MQEQPEKEQSDADSAPLSSEAPDAVQEESQAADIAESRDADALAEAAEVADSTEPPSDAPAPDDATGEQPDGAIIEPADTGDDLLADANAVDPKIDISLLEAYLFATHSPLTPGRLAELFNLESTKPIRKALRVLNEQYEATGRCFRVEQVAGGFQLLTLPEHGEHLKALHQREQDAKLTKAALETLAIIAYKQPILRADLEAIRGVASGETIRSLMEKHLVKIAGRAEEPGRPILYGTTKRFLEVFGLNTLKDLPHPDSPQNKQLSRAAQSLLSEGETTPTAEATGSGPQTPEPAAEPQVEGSAADDATLDEAAAGVEEESAAEAMQADTPEVSEELTDTAAEEEEPSPTDEEPDAKQN